MHEQEAEDEGCHGCRVRDHVVIDRDRSRDLGSKHYQRGRGCVWKSLVRHDQVAKDAGPPTIKPASPNLAFAEPFLPNRRRVDESVYLLLNVDSLSTPPQP